MKLIVIIGLVTPLIGFGSVLTGSIVPSHSDIYSFGAARNLIEFSIVIIATIPIFVVAFMMLFNVPISRYLFFGSWIIICISPLALYSVRLELNLFFVQFAINILFGLGITLYLFMNKSVNRYFSIIKGSVSLEINEP